MANYIKIKAADVNVANLTNSVKGIAELVTKTGLVNLDFADIKAIMGNGGVALIGMGESDSEGRAKEAVQKAITANPGGIMSIVQNSTGVKITAVVIA